VRKDKKGGKKKLTKNSEKKTQTRIQKFKINIKIKISTATSGRWWPAAAPR